MINVFTDGACSNNGKPDAKAGIGIYFGENDSRNLSKRVNGKQSNNTAELSAILEVFDILKEDILLGNDIMIYSDSTYSIRWCGEYGEKCEKNNWKRKTPIPNLELGKKLYLLCKEYPNVKLTHIKAHTGKLDILSLGNECADKLANEAIGLYHISHNRFYLNISYENKEIGKKYGAKWDKNKKKWYYEGLNTDINFKKLIELFPL